MIRTLYTALALAVAQGLAAQCTFTPTITPSNPILCPNTTEVLWTQVYDSYQWYRDGVAIPGANGQSHTVDASMDVMSEFSVEATLDGCTEMSAQVLVDGWVFLFPYVISDGDTALYIDGMGVAHHCEGDTVLLTLGMPYDTNIQWTDGGVAIPGANSVVLVVTQTGAYSVSAAPSICPNYILGLGVEVEIVFDATVQPVIDQSGGDLCVTPTGTSYQWYLNGGPIPGSNTACITPVGSGSYTVEVNYGPTTCTIPSDPWLVTGLNNRHERPRVNVMPNPSTGLVTITGLGGVTGPWSVLDHTGRVVTRGRGTGQGSVMLDLGSLPNGRYWFRVDGTEIVTPVDVIR
ncbi:MAG: hypothetical protein JNM31_01480 [Flavobacteriales bacterium]|nr:hypothetical protein [Flavobacteriales bacterium]